MYEWQGREPLHHCHHRSLKYIKVTCDWKKETIAWFLVAFATLWFVYYLTDRLKILSTKGIKRQTDIAMVRVWQFKIHG